jgi:HlyD family secretion protein
MIMTAVAQFLWATFYLLDSPIALLPIPLLPYSPIPPSQDPFARSGRMRFVPTVMKTCFPLFVLTVLLTGCAQLPNPLAQPSPTSSPKPVPAKQTAIVALGRIEPAGEIIKLSVANAQDSRVNQLLVKEGDRVEANQVIAILQGLDRRQADLRDAEADVRLRQAELTKAQRGDSKQAQRQAQRALIRKLQAQRSSQQAQRRAAIGAAQSKLRSADRTLSRRRSLQSDGAISRSDLDQAEDDRLAATSALAERQAELDQSDNTLAAEIDQEQSRLAELSEIRPIDINIAQAQLDKARIAVEQRQASLRDAQVRVPIAGQILRINTRVGEQINTSQGIVELAQTDQMYAIAEVAELDIGKVRTGQRATITSEYGGFPGKVQGVVDHIGLQVGRKTTQEAAGANPTNDQNARIIAVKIRLDRTDSPKVARFTAMQVRVRLELRP